MCMIDGGERAELWCESTARARKAQKCCECGRAINAGEIYHRVFGKQEGDTFNHKWCAHCDIAKQWLWENCGGHLCETIQEDIEQHVEEYPRFDLARLVVAMRRDWRKFRGGLMPIPKLPRPLKLGDARRSI